MAVVTRRHVRRDVGFAQRHGLAVIRVAIVLQAILVALAAALIAFHFEVAVLRRLNFVRRMAVGAHGAAFVALGQELAMHALVINLLDAHMTFAAGVRHVGMIDRGRPIDAAFDVMDAVAITARRRDDQSLLQQRHAMNAVLVMRRGLAVFHAILFRQALVAVTTRAGLRQIQFVHRRIRGRDRFDVVGAMAIPAISRPGGAHLMAQAVNARGVLFARLLMAAAAIRRRQFAFVHHVLDADMAINAVQRAVHRPVERIGGHQQRNRLAIHLPCRRGIEMTFEAIGIRDFLGRL
jgi:hypothetical protein